MKILLLNPTTFSGKHFIRICRNHRGGAGDTDSWPPIDLAEIAAVLRHGGFHQLRILDSVICGHSFKKMLDEILSFAPDLIIVHSITPALYDDKKMAMAVKTKRPNTKIAFFGVHATARPEDVLSEEAEFAIRGEPEYTALELAGALKNGKENDLRTIKGLSFFSNGQRHHNPDRELKSDLDSLPLPARDLLDNRRYVLTSRGAPFTIIRTSRGCPYRCIFCSSGFQSKNLWYSRSPRSIVAEIISVRETLDINDFMFFSDTFTLKENNILELCELIKKDSPGIRWICNSRTDSLTGTMVSAMKSAGCWLVSLGIENGDEAILKNSKKGASLGDARKSVELLRKAGIKSIGYYLFGLPGETLETIKKTVAFSKELDTDYAYFFTATPFPGTEYFEIAGRRGWLMSQDWERYYQGSPDVVSFDALSGDEISRAVPRAYRSFYLRPSRIVREFREIKKAEDIFRYLRIGYRMFSGTF